MKKLLFIFSAVAIGATFTSCNDSDDDNNNGTSGYSYKVRMTDAPAPYDRVNIDLQSVIVTDDNGVSTTLNTTAGIYNLLDYSNGLNVAIAEGNLSSSNVQSIRLVLGNNNTVVENGVSYNLTTQSSEQNGLNITIDQDLQSNSQNELIIDFDAYASVVRSNATTFRLRPVIREVDSQSTGRISGNIATSILLNNFYAVTATSATNVEYSSSVGNNGQFTISSLPAGTYTFTATPRNSFLPTVITNVNVTAGNTTSVGLVNMTN